MFVRCGKNEKKMTLQSVVRFLISMSVVWSCLVGDDLRRLLAEILMEFQELRLGDAPEFTEPPGEL